MNAISYEKAYCLFPRATLEQRRSVLSFDGPPSDRIEQCVQKYQQRGWIFCDYRDLSHSDPAFHTGERWINDKLSWVIPLNTTDIPPALPANPSSAPLSHDPVNICSWRVCEPQRPAMIDFKILESPALRYFYVISNYDLYQYLKNRLSVEVQTEKMKSEACLEDYK